jgi:type VII secretion protein EccE
VALGDPSRLLTDTPTVLPSAVSLLPPPGPDAPAVQVQLLVSGAPAPALRAGAGLPATSYRQLTEGRGAADQRAFLAVRVVRDGWPDQELRRTLASALRRLRRRLDQEGIAHQPLGPDALPTVLADLTHHGSGTPIREGWSGLYAGGLRQASARLGRVATLRPELAGQLIARLLALPATTTVVSVAAAPAGVDLVVRLAAPDAAGLSTAIQALRRLVGPVGLTVQRLDGEQLTGLAATLPLGLVGPVAPPGALGESAIELSGAGVMLGRNRQGEPVTVRLVRAEPTQALLVGEVRAAELVTLRALAHGVHVLVQSDRPHLWEPFLRAVSLPSDAIALAPPGYPVTLPPAGPRHPQLVLLDGSTGPPVGDCPWRTTVMVRDQLSAADADALARADLVILQPLSPGEAALAGATLGLGDGQEWLARIGADMVAVINRRTVRFARLAATPLELQLVGTPERVATT